MTRLSTSLLLTLMFCAMRLSAQTTITAQNITVQVSPSKAWTDGGIDLQTGDTLQLTASASSEKAASSGLPACDPKGLSITATTVSALPVPTAAAGALIARLHAQGAAPVLVGASTELKIEEASHLYLGMNVSGAAICQGDLAVEVHVTPAGSSTTGTDSKARGQQLKSQLATAAQVFMSGQFGIGNGGSGTDASAATPLKVSDTPLDSELRKTIDGLPRRVNDQFQNLGDMVNFVIVGNQKDVQAALEAATWHVADTSNSRAVMNALSETYDSKDYLAMPMSTLFLFGRRQDFGYEMAEPIAMVASRHHFRIWKSTATYKGQEVWCGAGTHDIGFAKDKRNGYVTHKIDPSVDGERDNIGNSLQKANKVKLMTYYMPKDAVQDAKNATGDGYHSNGNVLVIFLQ